MLNLSVYKGGTQITVKIKVIQALPESVRQAERLKVKQKKYQRKCTSSLLHHNAVSSQRHGWSLTYNFGRS